MSNGTILVADDSPTQQRLIRASLEAGGYDVVMPNMNGFQACKKIKKVRRELPVILLSTKNKACDEFWAKHQGADIYMTKPFDSRVLFANAVKLMTKA